MYKKAVGNTEVVATTSVLPTGNWPKWATLAKVATLARKKKSHAMWKF